MKQVPEFPLKSIVGYFPTKMKPWNLVYNMNGLQIRFDIIIAKIM